MAANHVMTISSYSYYTLFTFSPASLCSLAYSIIVLLKHYTGQGDVPKDSGDEVVRQYPQLSMADMQEDLSAPISTSIWGHGGQVSIT